MSGNIYSSDPSYNNPYFAASNPPPLLGSENRNICTEIPDKYVTSRLNGGLADNRYQSAPQPPSSAQMYYSEAEKQQQQQLNNEFIGMSLNQPEGSYLSGCQAYPSAENARPLQMHQQPQGPPPVEAYYSQSNQYETYSASGFACPQSAQPAYEYRCEAGYGLQTARPQQPPASVCAQTGFPPSAAIGASFRPPLPPQPGIQQAAGRQVSPIQAADNMPSAIDVMEDNKALWREVFRTDTQGVLPPLASTDFKCRDEGNCNPRFVRSSLYSVPTTADILKSIGVPFVLTIQTFASLHPSDQPIMLSDMGPQGPVRCTRCKAYMNPFVTFIDGGRRFQCSLCYATSEVPNEYFAHLDHTGRRVDTFQRAELCLGSYELMATAEYCKGDQLPNPPAYIFLLDVSQPSFSSGLVSTFCSRFVADILPHLPRSERGGLSLGFMTYDNQLHFYSLRRSQGTDSRPQMHVVVDLEEVFAPCIEGFLLPAEAPGLADLLAAISGHFEPHHHHQQPHEALLGPAIQAGLEVLKEAKRCGKLFILHSCLPTVECPGRLKNREDRRVLGTDRERTILQPASDFYTELGKVCVEAGCSVDIFLFPNAYVDVASIAEVPRITAGNLYKYNYFQADKHGDQFMGDLRQAVSQVRGFDAVMRVRTSTGTRPFEYLGNVNLPNTTDVELAAVDCNQAIVAEIRHDDKLTDNDIVFIQVALLYTTIGGERRIRVHNLTLASSSNPSEVFKLMDLDCYLNWLAKVSLRGCLSRSACQVTADILAKVVTILASYRRLCSGGAQAVSHAELILPEAIKLLPLYANCLTKTDAIRTASSTTFDDRSYVMFLVNAMSVKDSNLFLYPRIIPLTGDRASEEIPRPIRCSYARLEASNAYLVENGILALLWIGKDIDSSWVQQVFGVNSFSGLDTEKITLVPHDNMTSKYVCAVVSSILSQFSHTPLLRVVCQCDSAHETWVKLFMHEDRDAYGNMSYVEYLCHIHKEVRSLLS